MKKSAASDAEGRALAAIYLAHHIRRSREWFLQNYSWAGSSPYWEYHIGFPAENMDNDDMSATYQKVANAAVSLSDLPPPYSLTMAQEAERCDGEAKADLFPEVAALAIGHVKTPMRREGLHIFIDAGAGTLDVCSMIIPPPHWSDKLSILCAKVEPLGVTQIGQNTQIAEDCKQALRAVVYHTKMHRAPRQPQWRGEANLPFFICGGGANLDLYAQLPWQAHRGLLRNSSQVERRYLPKPDKLQAQDLVDGDFHRLAIAWGLSYPDLGEVELPKEIKNIPCPEVKPDHQKQYVGAEQV